MYAPQEDAVDHILMHKNSALFVFMGFGKTITTLSALQHLPKPALIIAPLRVALSVWQQEAERWGLPFVFSKILGSAKEREEAINTPADVYIINRDNIQWLVGNYKWKYKTLIIDESSSFKHRTSQRFKAIRSVLPRIERTILLTGTPAANGLMDLWAQLYLLDQGSRLGKRITEYRERYFYPAETNGHIVYKWQAKDSALERISTLISDICYTTDITCDLPRVDNIIHVDMSPKETAQYKKLKKDMVLPTPYITAFTKSALGNKLLQLANGMVYDEHKTAHHIHDHKIEALEEVIEEANGEPVLVLYAFLFDKDRILHKFKDARVLSSEQDIEDWNKGKIPMAVAHPASVGHGLNLQEGGNILCWFGLTFDLEKFQQAEARLIRTGQKRTVFVHYIITRNTEDERILPVLRDKSATQENLFLKMLDN